MSSEPAKDPVVGEGYAVASIDGIGDGPGFRKVRHALEVQEMGVNAIVLPSGIETGIHYHDEQEELYFVHKGAIEISFGDGTTHRLEAGGMARVDAPTHRKIKSVGDGDATYVVVGAKGGYVGRDGHAPEGEQRVVGGG